MPTIILDTSVLPRQGSLRNVVMSAVLRIAAQLGMRVCLPDIVVEESTHARLEAAEAAADRLGEAINQASKVMDLDPVYIPDPSEASESWRQELEASFTILQVDPANAKDALFREANRVAPAREGRGGRDAAIWLTVRAELLDTGELIYFVSANTADFGDKASQDLHPALREEIVDGERQLVFCRSLDALLEHLATKVDVQVSAETLLDMRAEMLDGLSGMGAWADTMSSEGFAGAITQVETVQIVRSYAVEDVALVHCKVTIRVEFPQYLDGVRSTTGRTFMVRFRCWLEVDLQTSRPTALDVFEVLEVLAIEDDAPEESADDVAPEAD